MPAGCHEFINISSRKVRNEEITADLNFDTNPQNLGTLGASTQFLATAGEIVKYHLWVLKNVEYFVTN
jgi:hypothetical protein